jgi:hypothetical protein
MLDVAPDGGPRFGGSRELARGLPFEPGHKIKSGDETGEEAEYVTPPRFNRKM